MKTKALYGRLGKGFLPKFEYVPVKVIAATDKWRSVEGGCKGYKISSGRRYLIETTEGERFSVADWELYFEVENEP